MARRFAGIAGLLLLSCGAPDRRAPEIAISNAWARETAPGQSNAAVYAVIVNRGDGADRLVAVETLVAGRAALHSSSNSGGIARMRALDAVDVPARSRIELRPGGTHIMLEGLRRPLRAGQAVRLNLDFKTLGHLIVAVRVMPATAADDHSAHGMSM